jgi:hypothetical protein
VDGCWVVGVVACYVVDVVVVSLAVAVGLIVVAVAEEKYVCSMIRSSELPKNGIDPVQN